MKRDDKETPRENFIKLVREKGLIYASPSHHQTHPDEIDRCAILGWEYDTELFAITCMGKRVVASKTMPAFYIYTGVKDDRQRI
jgi:hypothetical protein